MLNSPKNIQTVSAASINTTDANSFWLTKFALLAAMALLAMLLSGCSTSGSDSFFSELFSSDYAENESAIEPGAGNADSVYGPADGAFNPSAFERGTPLYVNESAPASFNGRQTHSRMVVEENSGLVLKDSTGGVVVLPTQAPQAPDADYVNARELKLRMRELAAQLVGGLDKSLAGHVALPTAFVNQDDFERSSSLGRFIVEQMFYEFNLRGVPTREYRMNGLLSIREDGEFILRREPGQTALDPKALYLVGTYYTEPNAVFVNARLIHADGTVVRAGQLVMPATPMTRRMAANSGKRLISGNVGLEIRDFYQEARIPEATTAFDQGQDIH